MDNVPNTPQTGQAIIAPEMEANFNHITSHFEEISEFVPLLVTGEVNPPTPTAILNTIGGLTFKGIRVGKTYTIGVTFFFTTNNVAKGFVAFRVPLSQISFLTGKTVNSITGSFHTNINNATSKYTGGGYCSLASNELQFNMAGNMQNQSTNRTASGTITIVVD